MNLKEAIKSGKRHKRPYMGKKYMPKCEFVEHPYTGPSWEQMPSEFIMLSVVGYCANDVMADDWEVEE